MRRYGIAPDQIQALDAFESFIGSLGIVVIAQNIWR
jgi:hypothetical protein